MDTLGQQDTPECMITAAGEIRSQLCAHYGVAECEGLQGTLIEAHAKAVGDPDTIAANWLSQEATQT